MKRIGAFFCVLLSVCLLLLASSCSGPSVFNSGTSGGTTTPPGGGGGGGTNGQVTLSLTSALTPIPGITVLSFDVSVIGLQISSPTNTVSFRTPATAQPVELTHLQADSVSMGSFPVIPGSFNSLSMTISPLTLTIFNQTGTTLVNTCPTNTVCEINPSVFSGTITVTPFPLNITSGLQTGIQLTLDIGNLVKSDATLDFARPGILSAARMPLSGQPAGQLTSLDDQVGRVTALNLTAGTFTFQSARAILAIKMDPVTTLFDGFADKQVCATDAMSCLQNNQSVSVDVGVNPDGTFVAREIQFEDPVFDEEVEGTVFAIDNPAQFEMVVTSIILGNTNILHAVNVSQPIVVQLRPSAKFEVDTKGFPVPPGSVNQFRNATDTSQLLPGQDVEVRINDTGTATTLPSFTSDRVRLRFTRVTGHASAIAPPTFFNIGDLPGLLATTSPVQVQTFPNGRRTTAFENVANVGSLNPADTVAIRALLIRNSAPPFFAAKVRKR